MRPIDDAAARWLIARFIGTGAPGAGDSFGALVQQHFGDDCAMLHLARIVRGAQAPERFDVMPESAGVRAVIEGASDELAPAVFDALLADLRHRASAGLPLETDPLIDPETRLPNRLLALDRLAQSIAFAHRHDTMLAVCAIRAGLSALGEFRRRAAREVADRLQHTVRELDTIGRLGSDEFVVVLNDLRRREYADIAVRKIRDILGEPFDLDGRLHLLPPRIGIAFYPAHGHDAPMLLDSARAAIPTGASVAVWGESTPQST